MRPSAVVDTSVLVSAFLFPLSLPGRIVGLAGEGAYTLWLSSILLEELGRSLRNPRLRKTYRHDDAAVDAWCARLRRSAQLLAEPLPEIGRICRDPDDDHVIAAAMVARAGWIVTGDRDLLDLGRYRAIPIVTARDFLGSLERPGTPT